MADATNTPVQPPDSGVSAPPAKRASGFLATTAGKIVVGVGALVVLLGILGAVFVMLGSGGLTGAVKSGATATALTATTSSASAPVPVEAVPVANPAELPLRSTFTFRNVFAPSVKPTFAAVEPTAAVETAVNPEVVPSTDVTSPTVEPQSTLVLTSIVTEGDAHKGVFTLDGVTYTAGNGETIGSSPWKVLVVGTDSVDMLYGDAPVTIAVGQGITK